MERLSVANLQPTVTPAVTFWDLAANHTDAFCAAFGTSQFNAYTQQIALAGDAGMNAAVVGPQGLSGVDITGVDQITGDSFDVMPAGNGAALSEAGKDHILDVNSLGEVADEINAGQFGNVPGKAIFTVEPNFIDGLGNNDIWISDPNKTYTTTNGDNSVRIEGLYIALDGDGHPVEFDGNGHPIVHQVFSFSPDADGAYTIGLVLDNPLDAGQPEPGQLATDVLTAGKKYYFTFTDGGGGEAKIETFAGEFIHTHTDRTGLGDDRGLIASDQATLAGSLSTSFFDQILDDRDASDIFIDNKIDNKISVIGDGVDLVTDPPKADDQVPEPQDTKPAEVQPHEDGNGHPDVNYVSSGAWFTDAAIKLVGLEHHSDTAILLT